jgi:hypothetical protein
MFIVYYRNQTDFGKIIRPTPFISISYASNRNKDQINEGNYSITLNGIILSNAGSPLSGGEIEDILNIGPNYENNENGDYVRPEKEIIGPGNERAMSVFNKQQAIRALFAHDGQKMEYSSIRNDEAMFYFYPSVESISFEEGTYVNSCRYTINLVAPIIFDINDNPLDLSASLDEHIEDYSDSLSIEVDESFGRTSNGHIDNEYASIIPRMYKVTHTVSATGKTVYLGGDRYEAWEQAKDFVKNKILKENLNSLPLNNFNQIPSNNPVASGLLDIPDLFVPYNQIRSENIDKTAGSFSITDSWILSTDNAVENYTVSSSKSSDSNTSSVSIEGTIKGLFESGPSHQETNNTLKFSNAISKFNNISNNQNFDINSSIYKRANKALSNQNTIFYLNPNPTAFSVTINEFSGEVNYSVSYDSRPINVFGGTLNENITISDTYPGDVYSLIQVLARPTGPIFQYIGGRTEYQRSLNIDFTVPRGNIHYNNASIKQSFVYSKPSMNPLLAPELLGMIDSCSPLSEPNIRKCFVNPVSENWDPITGKYSVQISWVYELNR